MILKIRRKEKKFGDVTISGAKNSAIPIIVASLLTNEKVILHNIPDIKDVRTLLEIIGKLGPQCTFTNNTLTIYPTKKVKTTIFDDNVRKMRGSYYLLGVFLSKYKKIKMYNQGGCDLGYRPINFHLDGFKRMGTHIIETTTFISLKARKLLPAIHNLDFPSVGATINLMLASVLVKGKTIINNCAKEPEIIDVANFLKAMGANISGEGTSTITIMGVKALSGCEYTIISDRIEAGTYAILAAILNGGTIRNVNTQHLHSLIKLLQESNCVVYSNVDTLTIEQKDNLKPFNITIAPFPGFPTDLGQPLAVLGTQIEGRSLITETIFKKRVSHITELKKMGANISILDEAIYIDGKTPLSSQKLYASDLRGAASLVLAASLNSDFSYIYNIETFLRGYENPLEKLANFGIECYLVE